MLLDTWTCRLRPRRSSCCGSSRARAWVCWWRCTTSPWPPHTAIAVLLVEGRVIASGTPTEVQVRRRRWPHLRSNRVTVIPHPQSGAPIVVPAVMELPHA